MKIDEVLDSLSGFSRQELRELKARVDYYLEKKSGDSLSLEAEIFSLLNLHLKDAKAKTMPFSVFSKSRLFREYRAGVLRFAEILSNDFKAKTRVEQIQAIHIMFSLIVDSRRSSGRSPCYKNMIHGMSQVDEIIDRAFPGYRMNGMLPALLKQKDRFRMFAEDQP